VEGNRNMVIQTVRPEENRMLTLLNSLSPTMKWLSKTEPVADADVPDEYLADLKQLENIGLVSRRNRTLVLQRERLKRLLEQQARLSNVIHGVSDFLE